MHLACQALHNQLTPSNQTSRTPEEGEIERARKCKARPIFLLQCKAKPALEARFVRSFYFSTELATETVTSLPFWLPFCDILQFFPLFRNFPEFDVISSVPV